MKDLVKINILKDRKEIEREIQHIRKLQDLHQYPLRYKMPLAMQFELTSNCNVRCKHCYNNSGANGYVCDAMTPERWLSFARYIVKNGGIFQCIISGGEPLLLGDTLFDLMDILHEDGTFFHVISNCYLMTQEKVRKFSKYRYKWFQVSIDGASPERHDEFRQRSGSWQRATQAAFWLSKEGIPLTIAHSVIPDNLYEIDEMCALAFSLGAGSIIIGEVTPSGRSANSPELLLSHEQKNFLMERIQENSTMYAGKMTVLRSSSVKNQLLRYQGTPNTGVIIRPNGDIRLDCMAPFTIGNVLEDDFCDIWEKKSSICWQLPVVQDYINSYEDFADTNSSIKNYFDSDIRL